MNVDRIRLEVYVNLDPVPGTFHTEESACNTIGRILNDSIPHYKPTVSIGTEHSDDLI